MILDHQKMLNNPWLYFSKTINAVEFVDHDVDSICGCEARDCVSDQFRAFVLGRKKEGNWLDPETARFTGYCPIKSKWALGRCCTYKQMSMGSSGLVLFIGCGCGLVFYKKKLSFFKKQLFLLFKNKF